MLNKVFTKERWGLWVVKANHFFSRPIGMLAAISLLILIVFVYFAIDNQRILEQIKSAADSSKQAAERSVAILDKQDETLEAIRQVAIDNKITSDQKTDIIICMLQVPVNQRTSDTKENCREQAESSPPFTFQSSDPAPAVSQTESSNTSQRGNSQPQNTNPGQDQTPSTPTPQTPPNEPTAVDFIEDSLNDLVDGVQDLVGGLL